MLTNMKALDQAIDDITQIATDFGLDFYPMRYEICPADIIYTFGAYGMPTRFSHWSFGKQFYKMKLHYDLGLSQIYELVINSNPCYAFLLDTNSLIQNKMIVAHVLAHCDFFKNNVRFSNTRRDMVESMTATAERIEHYEMVYGKKEVERFLDAVLAVQEHIDPSIVKNGLLLEDEQTDDQESTHKRETPYDDLWRLDDDSKADKTAETEASQSAKRPFPPRPEKDLLLFLEEYSRELTNWQRDILTMMREEMLYFWPQLETKIMNEGWASFWHQRIMRKMNLTTDETIEFATLNAGVVQPSKTQINPYYLGLKMLEDIEARYNEPSDKLKKLGVKPNSGRAKLFEVREVESDASFIRNYLTKELVQREDMYLFERKGTDYRVTEKDYEGVRDELIAQRVNGGFPYIEVADGDYLQNGYLYLVHRYEGTELDLNYLEHVLPYIYQLWGRLVYLETVIEEKPIVYSYDGYKVKRRFL